MRCAARLSRPAFAAAFALAALVPAARAADGALAVADAYARAPIPAAPAAAAYIDLVNHGDSDDMLLGVASDIAARVELHSVETDEQGMTRMLHMAEGVAVPAGGILDMGRGGLHVMFMGLQAPLEQGASIEVVLTFRNAGEMRVSVPIDHERTEGHDAEAGTEGEHSHKDGASGH